MGCIAKPWAYAILERKQWMVALFFGCFMLYACRTAMPLCIPALEKENGWDKSQSGTVLSAFFWGYTLTQVLGGYLSDKIGGLAVISTAAVGWSLLTFWTPHISGVSFNPGVNFNLLVFSRVLIGACQGVYFPSLSSLLCQRISEEERSFTFATVASGAHAGTLLCGSLGSLLLEHFGWQSTFYAMGFLAMAWLILLRQFLIVREKRKALIMSVKDMTSSGSSTKLSTQVPWIQLFKKSAFWAMIFGHFCTNNCLFILLSWLPTYFHDNFPSAKGWVFNVVPWLVCIPSVVSSGVIADKLIGAGFAVTPVRKAATLMSLGGSAFFLVCLSLSSTFEMALFCMACAVACTGFQGGGLLVNPQDVAPDYAGSVFGLMNTAGALPGFVGVYIAGHILNVTQSWAYVFNVTAALSTIGCIVYLTFGTGDKIL